MGGGFFGFVPPPQSCTQPWGTEGFKVGKLGDHLVSQRDDFCTGSNIRILKLGYATRKPPKGWYVALMHALDLTTLFEVISKKGDNTTSYLVPHTLPQIPQPCRAIAGLDHRLNSG